MAPEADGAAASKEYTNILWIPAFVSFFLSSGVNLQVEKVRE
jgi:hypothetical protein